jgi:hypothetical protein
MPVVRRGQRDNTNIVALPQARRTAAATAQSEGAGFELARGRRNAAREMRTATTNAARGQFGDQVTGLGVALFAELQERERAAADQTALLKASNRLSDWRNQYLYDQERGAFRRKGEAAMPLPEETRAEFDRVAGEIEAGLGSDAQRAAFAKLRSQEWQGIDLQVRRHVFGEMQEFRAGELKAFVANTTNAAIQASADPRLVQVELSKAVGAIRANAPALGVGPEAVEQQVAAVQSQVHVGVISNLLAEDKDQAATAYFEATREQIAGDKLDAVTKALEEGSLRGQAQRKADEIVRAGGTLTEQRERARAIEDPKLRDQVMQRIEHEAVVADRAKREREEAEMKTGYDILDRTPDVTKIPPALWTSYDGGTRSAMLSYARARAKGEPVNTDLPTFYTLMNQAGDAPEAFAKENLLRYRHKLSEQDFQQLAGLQLSIKSADRKATEKDLAPFQTRMQLLDATLSLHGIDPNAKPDTAEGKAIAQLRRMLDRRVELLQAGGVKATNQDIQSEIDAILSASVTVPGSWWNIFPGGRSFTDTTKRLVDVTIDDISATDRKLVEEALRRQGLPVTDATILDRYIEGQLRMQRQQGR